MFNWEMDLLSSSSSAEVSKRQAAIEAVAKVTTTTMLRFSKKGKKKKRARERQPRTQFKVQLVTSYLSRYNKVFPSDILDFFFFLF